ncbi:MAG: GNAT family N-acetyltransferase [Chloroflexi bacterium]|nr:GNAT family N-acetyltransferase [Chloroflexota bacterium]
MPLEFVIFDGPAEFLATVDPLLRRREAEHSLLLGIARGLATGEIPQESYTGDPGYYAVREDGRPRIAALRTPPHKLLMTRASGAELDCLIDGIHCADGDNPGVQAESETAREFAERWCRKSRKISRAGMKMRIHELTEVIPPVRPRGHFRAATDRDVPLLAEWLVAFAKDAGTKPHSSPSDVIATAIAYEQAYLWEDREVVTMTLYGRATENGVSIRGVYTPPDRRNNGYASALVASVSQTMIDRGKRFCCLFTDLANPTSNHIYAAIGYRAVADVDDYWFD